MEESMEPRTRRDSAWREVLQTPDEVAAMLRLKGLGWGIKQIAKELGCSDMTVHHYVAQRPWLPQPRWLPKKMRCQGSRIGWRSVFDAMSATQMLYDKSLQQRRTSSFV